MKAWTWHFRDIALEEGPSPTGSSADTIAEQPAVVETLHFTETPACPPFGNSVQDLLCGEHACRLSSRGHSFLETATPSVSLRYFGKSFAISWR